MGGHIDGPSAGLLTAATLTALIRNKKLLPATTMTLKNPRALTAQLALAQRRTLEACGRASREFGLIPLPARIRYQSAMREREGTDNRKTDALVELWLASSWCNFAVSK